MIRTITFLLAMGLSFQTALAQQQDSVKVDSKHAFTVGTDVMLLMGGALGHRSVLRYEYGGILYVQLGGGYAHLRAGDASADVVNYSSQGNFIMPGVGLYIPLHITDRDFMLTAGVNYVRSFYDEKGTIELIDPNWKTTLSTPFTIQNCVLSAVQMEGGALYRYKRFRFIGTARHNRFLNSLSPSQSTLLTSSDGQNRYQSYYAPGLGRVHEGNIFNTINISFTVQYILLRSKK